MVDFNNIYFPNQNRSYGKDKDAGGCHEVVVNPFGDELFEFAGQDTYRKIWQERA